MARRAFQLNPEVFELQDEERMYEIGDFVRIDSALYVKGADSFELVVYGTTDDASDTGY